MVIKKTTKEKALKFVKDYARYLQKEEKLPIQSVYLFGSYVKNRQREWSDIDVAVISKTFKGKRDPYEYLWKRLRDIDVHRGIEPIGFHPRDFVMDNPIAAEVKRHGIRIKM